jgi:hypothetical protein
VSTSTWRLYHNETEKRDSDYTTTLGLQNVGTGQTVIISLTQDLHGPASDLVGALRALTQSLISVANKDDDPKETRH